MWVQYDVKIEGEVLMRCEEWAGEIQVLGKNAEEVDNLPGSRNASFYAAQCPKKKLGCDMRNGKTRVKCLEGTLEGIAW